MCPPWKRGFHCCTTQKQFGVVVAGEGVGEGCGDYFMFFVVRLHIEPGNRSLSFEVIYTTQFLLSKQGAFFLPHFQVFRRMMLHYCPQFTQIL